MRYSFAARGLAAAALIAYPLTPVRAQICTGGASFANGRFQVSGGYSTTSDHVKGLGADLSAGARSGPFGSVGLSRISYPEVEPTTAGYGIGGGYSIPVGKASGTEFCPLVSLAYQVGPDQNLATGPFNLDTTRFTHRATAVSFGAAVGRVIASTPSLDVIPSLEAEFVTTRGTVLAATTGPQYPTSPQGSMSETVTQNYGGASVSVGVVIHKVLTFSPALTHSFAISGSTACYSVGVGWNFGPHGI